MLRAVVGVGLVWLLLLTACSGDDTASTPLPNPTTAPTANGDEPTVGDAATDDAPVGEGENPQDGAGDNTGDAAGDPVADGTVGSDGTVDTVGTDDARDATTEPFAIGYRGVTPIADPASLASIEPFRCPFETPSRTFPICHRVTVPEDWDNPDGTTIDLTVAVFSGADNQNASPVVYLEGGPGGNALESLFLTWSGFYDDLALAGDVIVWDQRGAGLSQPELACDELDRLFEQERTVIRPVEEEEQLALEAIAECRTDFADRRINPANYNSAASATDLEAIRALLGYEQWNLLGISYGTRLAQSAVRLYPDGVRSVILDAIVPIADDRPAIFAPNGARAFEQLFAGCQADDLCRERHPDLRTRFFDVVDQWNAAPVSADGINPLTLEPIAFALDGDDLLDLVFGALYSQTAFASIPELIEEAEAGDTRVVGLIASQDVVAADFFTSGMFISVGCTEEIPFSDPTMLDDSEPRDPYYAEFADGFNGRFFYEACAVWNTESVDPVENVAVTSTIPTLLMSGAYDPITPPTASSLLAPTLSTVWEVTFPHEGHGTVPTDCGTSIVLAFLADPSSSPDTSCVADSPRPAWTTQRGAAVSMVPFTVDDLGISVSGLRPEAWADQGAGVFARGDTVADPALLLVQNSFGLPAESIFAIFGDALGWPDTPTFDRAETINGVDWVVYAATFPDAAVRAAVSDAGSDSVIVLVVGDPDDFPHFEEAVFEPALSAARAE